MSNDMARKDFEVWAAENGMGLHLVRSDSGLYVSPVTQKFLNCWMGSRAKQAAEVEVLLKDAGRYRQMRKFSCDFRSALPNHELVSEADYDAECDSFMIKDACR